MATQIKKAVEVSSVEAQLLAAAVKIVSLMVAETDAEKVAMLLMSVQTDLMKLGRKGHFELHMKLLVACGIESPESAQRRIENFDSSIVRQSLHEIMGGEGCGHCHCGEGEKCCYCGEIIPPVS